MADNTVRLKTSQYNFAVQSSAGTLLFNAASGAVQLLGGPDAAELGRALSGAPVALPDGSLEEDLRTQLMAASFLVPAEKDELAEVRERFWQARDLTPAVLTITTTMDCNLGCCCYEERSKDRLAIRDVDAVVAVARDRLHRGGKKALHVDWYGGEPLMNLEFLEAASPPLQALCAAEGVGYHASVISNGTCWPEDVGDFVRRHRIRQVQITFDGLRAHHDRRRHYRKEYAPGASASSFDVAVALIGRLLDHVRVDIRFNIDRGNMGDLLPFARFARSLGWFQRKHAAVLQPARLAAYTEHSGFLRDTELSLPEFYELRNALRAEVGDAVQIEESEAPDGFPLPKTSVCAALAADSVVVGADRLLYRCGLQVGETSRAVGTASERRMLSLSMVGEKSDADWWERFDPTRLPSCSRCSFLPVCWGGCPKKHLEGDQHAIAEQGAYWRANLPRLIANGVAMELLGPSEFIEADQFRGGVPVANG